MTLPDIIIEIRRTIVHIEPGKPAEELLHINDEKIAQHTIRQSQLAKLVTRTPEEQAELSPMNIQYLDLKRSPVLQETDLILLGFIILPYMTRDVKNNRWITPHLRRFFSQ